jgi:hypothetical protein
MALAVENEKLTEMERMLQDLTRLRDEVHLKLHLATLEARDEWLALEPRWRELQRRVDRLRSTLGEVSADLWQATRLLGEELATAYHRLRRAV